MTTTIQISEDTKKQLDNLKSELDAKDFNEVILRLLSEEREVGFTVLLDDFRRDVKTIISLAQAVMGSDFAMDFLEELQGINQKMDKVMEEEKRSHRVREAELQGMRETMQNLADEIRRGDIKLIGGKISYQ